VKGLRHDHMTDTELLDHYYKDHDQKWIGFLLERYTLLLLGVCMKYLKNEQEARDCVQQIYLKVLTELPKYRVEYFKSWLYMVAKNHCLMRLRQHPDRKTEEITEHTAVASADLQTDELLRNEKTYDLLEEALKELSPEQRECVILFYLKKNSYAQISQKLGYQPMQVKSYIQNGKRNLRIILERKLKQSSKS
jgi:RNA polymerase sigma factor (sigma-70 family)